MEPEVSDTLRAILRLTKELEKKNSRTEAGKVGNFRKKGRLVRRSKLQPYTPAVPMVRRSTIGVAEVDLCSPVKQGSSPASPVVEVITIE